MPAAQGTKEKKSEGDQVRNPAHAGRQDKQDPGGVCRRPITCVCSGREHINVFVALLASTSTPDVSHPAHVGFADGAQSRGERGREAA